MEVKPAVPSGQGPRARQRHGQTPRIRPLMRERLQSGMEFCSVGVLSGKLGRPRIPAFHSFVPGRPHPQALRGEIHGANHRLRPQEP